MEMDFMVQDERWSMYIVDDEWDIDRSLEEKAGKKFIDERGFSGGGFGGGAR